MKNTNSIGLRLFGETQSNAMRAYAQSEQYHTIVKSRVRLTRYQSRALKLSRANRLVNPQISNKELLKKRSQAPPRRQ